MVGLHDVLPTFFTMLEMNMPEGDKQDNKDKLYHNIACREIEIK
jgi:hypothetical protein